MDVDLAAIIPQLANVPVCAHPAYGALIAGPCGPDLECICSNDKFFITLQGVLAIGNCTPPESQTVIVNTRKICVDAVPWLARDRGPEVLAAITILMVLATIAVAIRFFARSVTSSLYGWDDWLMLCALIWEYGLCVVQYFAVHYGFGKHILMLDLDQITGFSKAFFASLCVFPTACLALKFSILFFYHRIFAIRKFTICVIIISAICIAWYIAFIVSSFLICRPLNCWWDKSNPDCKCINATHVGYFITSPPDILSNLAILILPIPWLWNLQMQTRKKVAIILILLLGSFSVLGSIIRVPFLSKLNYDDISYTIVNSGIWLNVEVAIGIVSGCLPLFRPLCTRAFSSQLRSRFSQYRGTNSGSQRLPDHHHHHHRQSPSPFALGKNNNNNKKKISQNSSTIRSGLASTGGGGDGDYWGQRRNRSWYNGNAAAATAAAEGGSEEDMVPMGKIKVRHDVEWGGDGAGQEREEDQGEEEEEEEGKRGGGSRGLNGQDQ